MTGFLADTIFCGEVTVVLLVWIGFISAIGLLPYSYSMIASYLFLG